MIYLDSGATSILRPKSVLFAAWNAAGEGNPGRGGHRAAMAAAKEVFACREALSSHFGSGDPDGVCFFYNATTALNVVVKSLVPPGGTVLLSDMEHNALRRPALSLEKKGVRVIYFKGYGKKEEILLSFREKLKQKPDLAAFLHQSNVCPQRLPVKELCEEAKKAGVTTLVDCAQSGGHEKIDISLLGCDAIVLPSHKGLMGIQGAGALICSERMKRALEKADTLMEGGSGMHSFEKGMPELLPERLEWGTPALPAIASMRAGVRFLEERGYERISARLSLLARKTEEGVGNIPGLRLCGDGGEKSPCGPLLFVSEKKDQAQLCGALYDEGVCLREGFHCAPLAHKAIGTGESGGVRVSFSFFNTSREIDRFLKILSDCAKA